MYLPTGPRKLRDTLHELANTCMGTRRTRIEQYDEASMYYHFGGNADRRAPSEYNLFGVHADKYISFLYSQEHVRFTITPDNTNAKTYKNTLDKALYVTKQLNTAYHSMNVSSTVGDAIKWGTLFGTSFIKFTRTHNSTTARLVLPSDVGVINESIDDVANQEVVCHRYYMSLSQALRLVNGYGDEKNIEKKLKDAARMVGSDQVVPLSTNARRVVINSFTNTNASGRIIGDRPATPVPNNIIIGEPMIAIDELWVWSEQWNDYVAFMFVAPNIIIQGGLKMCNPYMAGNHPFVQITPHHVPNYVWGAQRFARGYPIQDRLNERIRNIWRLQDLQVDRVRALIGGTRSAEDAREALKTPGSWLVDDGVTAKIQDLTPPMPDDTYIDFAKLEDMMAKLFHLSDLLQGKGESGVRSKSHASMISRMGSGPIRDDALRLEQAIAQVGWHLLRNMQKTDMRKHVLDDEHSTEMLLADFDVDYTVRVDAHSASPIFVEDIADLAMRLHETKVIDGEDLLGLLPLPNRDMLSARYVERLKAARTHNNPSASASSPSGPEVG